jgi:hypothetical protein
MYNFSAENKLLTVPSEVPHADIIASIIADPGELSASDLSALRAAVGAPGKLNEVSRLAEALIAADDEHARAVTRINETVEALATDIQQEELLVNLLSEQGSAYRKATLENGDEIEISLLGYDALRDELLARGTEKGLEPIGLSTRLSANTSWNRVDGFFDWDMDFDPVFQDSR